MSYEYLKTSANRKTEQRNAPHLLISMFDKQRLKRLISVLRTVESPVNDFGELTRKLEESVESMPHEMPPDVVTMNSMILVTNAESGASNVYTIAYPSDADADRGRISILSPLGTAMLGHSVGDVVTLKTPHGLGRWQIDKVIYQPEAAGDFHR